MENIKITDIVPTKYSDFLLYCAASGKVFISELTTVDFIAFRTKTGQSREYIKGIRNIIDNPVVFVKNAHAKELEEPTTTSNEVNTENYTEDEVVSTITEIAQEKGSDEREAHEKAEEDEFSTEDIAPSDNTKPVTQKAERKEGNLSASASQAEEPRRIARKPDRADEKEAISLSALFDVDPSLFEKTEIESLNLGVRATNCLKNTKLKTVADVLRYTIEDLRGIPNMGVKSIDETLKKLRDYITNPDNIRADVHDDSASIINTVRKKVPLEPALKAAIEALLIGDTPQTENLTEDQRAFFEKLENAVNTVGRDICMKAYLNPNYSFEVAKSLWTFAANYFQYCAAVDSANERIHKLTGFMQARKVKPFIRAYSEKSTKNMACLFSACDEDTTIRDVPRLYDKLRDNDDFKTLSQEVEQFLTWLDFDVKGLIANIYEKIRTSLSGKNTRAVDVFELRAKGETLEAVGTLYGVTRERIRQIELKVFKVFWNYYNRQKYDLIMLTYAIRNGDSLIRYDELKEVVGDHFATILWTCIKHDQNQKSYYFSKNLDAIVIKVDGTAGVSDEKLLSSVTELVNELPALIEKTKKESILAQISESNSIPIEIVESVFNGVYHQANMFYHRGKLTIVFMCDYVLKNRFPAGFKIADEFEYGRFKECLKEFFGEKASSMTSRALDAKIREVGVLCDRGRYIHPDYLCVEQSVIDAINDYIEKSPRSLLPYGEIFEGMRESFEGTQITNRFLLQGALKKYGCRFNTGKDSVRKSQSVSFVDELESFVEDRGIVHKSEIFAEFTSLGEAGLGQVVARSANVFNIDNGYYIHASQFDIQPEDYEPIRSYLNEACKEIPVNIRSVHEAVAIQFPDFMYRNDFEDRNKLFSALNYMFRGEFNFSRPYIAKLGVSDISNRSVILQHIADYDSIGIEELIDICEENNIDYVALSYLCQSLAPDYFRIDRTTLMRREIAGITDKVIEEAVNNVKEMLEVNDYVVGSKISDFIWFPEIDVDWNEYLLESIIIQSGEIDVVYLIGNSFKHPNAVYVSSKYKGATFDSLLLSILEDEVQKGVFISKVEMRDWLQEEGFIEGKLPNFLESTKYFYVDDQGVHRTSK